MSIENENIPPFSYLSTEIKKKINAKHQALGKSIQTSAGSLYNFILLTKYMDDDINNIFNQVSTKVLLKLGEIEKPNIMKQFYEMLRDNVYFPLDIEDSETLIIPSRILYPEINFLASRLIENYHLNDPEDFDIKYVINEIIESGYVEKSSEVLKDVKSLEMEIEPEQYIKSRSRTIPVEEKMCTDEKELHDLKEEYKKLEERYKKIERMREEQTTQLGNYRKDIEKYKDMLKTKEEDVEEVRKHLKETDDENKGMKLKLDENRKMIELKDEEIKQFKLDVEKQKEEMRKVIEENKQMKETIEEKIREVERFKQLKEEGDKNLKVVKDRQDVMNKTYSVWKDQNNYLEGINEESRKQINYLQERLSNLSETVKNRDKVINEQMIEKENAIQRQQQQLFAQQQQIYRQQLEQATMNQIYEAIGQAQNIQQLVYLHNNLQRQYQRLPPEVMQRFQLAYENKQKENQLISQKQQFLEYLEQQRASVPAVTYVQQEKRPKVSVEEVVEENPEKREELETIKGNKKEEKIQKKSVIEKMKPIEKVTSKDISEVDSVIDISDSESEEKKPRKSSSEKKDESSSEEESKKGSKQGSLDKWIRKELKKEGKKPILKEKIIEKRVERKKSKSSEIDENVEELKVNEKKPKDFIAKKRTIPNSEKEFIEFLIAEEKMIKEGIAILFKINKHQELTEKEKAIIPNKEKEMLFTKAKDTIIKIFEFVMQNYKDYIEGKIEVPELDENIIMIYKLYSETLVELKELSLDDIEEVLKNNKMNFDQEKIRKILSFYITNKGILFESSYSLFYSIAKAIYEKVDITKYPHIALFIKNNPILEDVITAFASRAVGEYYPVSGLKKTKKD